MNSPSSAPYCSKYVYDDVTSVGSWTGYACGQEAVTMFAWPASQVIIASSTTTQPEVSRSPSSSSISMKTKTTRATPDASPSLPKSRLITSSSPSTQFYPATRTSTESNSHPGVETNSSSPSRTTTRSSASSSTTASGSHVVFSTSQSSTSSPRPSLSASGSGSSSPPSSSPPSPSTHNGVTIGGATAGGVLLIVLLVLIFKRRRYRNKLTTTREREVQRMQQAYYISRYPRYGQGQGQGQSQSQSASPPAYDALSQAREQVLHSPPPQMNYSDLGRI